LTGTLAGPVTLLYGVHQGKGTFWNQTPSRNMQFLLISEKGDLGFTRWQNRSVESISDFAFCLITLVLVPVQVVWSLALYRHKTQQFRHSAHVSGKAV